MTGQTWIREQTRLGSERLLEGWIRPAHDEVDSSLKDSIQLLSVRG